MHCTKCNSEFEPSADGPVTCPKCGADAAAGPRCLVFISYGREEPTEEFVDRLAQDLEQAGVCQVFYDRRGIKEGQQWDSALEDSIRDSSEVLAVMTHYALRGQSVCRNEVVLAFMEQKVIIPLRKEEGVRPNLLLCRNQWVDFTGDYQAGLDSLLRHLRGEAKALRPPALHEQESLAALDFGPEIAAYMDCFVGRGWLSDELDQWLGQEAQKAFIIVGEPGLGKSAIAAWLTQDRQDQVVGIHFCRSEEALDPTTFVSSLLAQLCTQMPEFLDAVDAGQLEQKHESAEIAFRRLIVEPAYRIAAPAEPKLIIIDALDEAARRNGETIVNVIANRAMELPAWLRIVATSRPDEAVLETLSALDPYRLAADSANNLGDVKLYLAQTVETDGLATKLGADPAGLNSRLAELAQGNFLYAKLVVSALDTGKLTVQDLGQLAPGLGEYYSLSFGKLFPDGQAFDRAYRPLLEVLCAACTRLPLGLLAHACGLSDDDARAHLRPLSRFLRRSKREGQDEYLLFHKSVMDWLTTGASDKYRCDLRAGHTRLAQSLCQADSDSPYARRYLPQHLLEAGDYEALQKILLDLDFFCQYVSSGNNWDWMRLWNALPGEPAVAALCEEAAAARLAAQGEGEEEAKVLHLLGQFLYYRGDLEAARRLLRRAVEIREALFGPYDPEVAESLHALAEAARRADDYAESAELFERARDALESVLGPSSPAVGACLHDMAELHHDLLGRAKAVASACELLGVEPCAEVAELAAQLLDKPFPPGAENLDPDVEFRQAEQYYERSLQIARQCFPGAHPLVARCLNDLGVLYWEHGQRDEAMQRYQEALPVFREACGHDYLEAGEVLHNIAQVKEADGDMLLAFADYAEAFAIVAATCPTTHTDFAHALRSLHACWKRLGTEPEALAAQEAAVARLRPILRGRHSPLLAGLRTSLRAALATVPEGVPQLLAQVSALLDEATDCSPADKCGWLFLLATVLRGLDRQTEAEEMLRKALRGQAALLREEGLPPQELEALAGKHMTSRAYESAYPLLRRALQLREADPATPPATIGTACNQLGYVGMRLGRTAEAEQLLRRALDIARAVPDVAPTSLAPTLNNLAEVLIQTGKLDEAEALCEEALAVRQETGDPSRIAVTLMTMGSLAVARAGQADDLDSTVAQLSKAEELFSFSLHGHARDAGAYPEMLIELLVRYGALLTEMGKPDEAAERDSQAEQVKALLADQVWW